MDLKPSNILLSSPRKPVLKLADFGFAQHFSDEETATKIKGSPLYMAPEMLLKRKYDAKVDIWSVGIILYEALFGKAPYKSETIEEVRYSDRFACYELIDSSLPLPGVGQDQGAATHRHPPRQEALRAVPRPPRPLPQDGPQGATRL